ncbi:hypothetical protein DBIPINDM_007543 (plasmid) [Mesorhizobium sp. AR02]|uniref:hypothetical protein n=1 Tax=Mesorhizobium sp. AR02 TaxID=2865837 RepID=UPI00215F1173|nr:hypothetical protein [Mesorhizobium sp. AR02]UVK50231.1 hypothetical protein DBIPINDM_007543 [Mesorhizobium sp. AR02]
MIFVPSISSTLKLSIDLLSSLGPITKIPKRKTSMDRIFRERERNESLDPFLAGGVSPLVFGGDIDAGL